MRQREVGSRRRMRSWATQWREVGRGRQPGWVRHLVHERLHDVELLRVLMEGTTGAVERSLARRSKGEIGMIPRRSQAESRALDHSLGILLCALLAACGHRSPKASPDSGEQEGGAEDGNRVESDGYSIKNQTGPGWDCSAETCMPVSSVDGGLDAQSGLPLCGDGILSGEEECDLGQLNGVKLNEQCTAPDDVLGLVCCTTECRIDLNGRLH